MPTIKGNLLFVSSRAAHVSEVWVRAPKVRTHAEGLVTTGNDHFPVIDGKVEFTAVPGPAVLALISQGRAVDTVPIVVGDADTQTLRQVVNAAEIADDATKREIEKLAAQAIHLVDSSTENARKAQDGATRAETAAGEAKQSESNAEDAARRSSSSASSANRSSIWVSQAEDRVKESEASAEKSAQTAATQASSAEDSASAAKDSASSAAASESGAKESASSAGSSATAASSSASKAAESEQNADKSASDAAGSATIAKQDADRAANIANSTSWDGDRLTVNGKTSPSLTGPKGDPGASTWNDVTGKPVAVNGSDDLPVAPGYYSAALGMGANAAGSNSIALGASTSAEGVKSTAIGYGVVASEDNTIVIGADGQTVILAGRNLLTEIDVLKARIEALENK